MEISKSPGYTFRSPTYRKIGVTWVMVRFCTANPIRLGGGINREWENLVMFLTLDFIILSSDFAVSLIKLINKIKCREFGLHQNRYTIIWSDLICICGKGVWKKYLLKMRAKYSIAEGLNDCIIIRVWQIGMRDQKYQKWLTTLWNPQIRFYFW